jgi:transcriptional regulator with XRE-family HTH domain
MSIESVTSKSTREAIEALHRVRLDRDLSYEALAEELGLSRRNLFRLMNDKRATMHDRTLHKIRRYLISAREEASA